MKLYIKDMTDEQLNEWAARAQGWKFHRHPRGEFSGYWTGRNVANLFDYDPVHNGQQAIDLQVAFKLHVIPLDYDFSGTVDSWMAYQVMQHPDYEGSTPNKAIVRAAIASVYGEYVEVDNA